MKKSLIILALLPVLFFGCKKGGSTDEPKPEEKLYEVKFSATPFSQTINPMSKSSTSPTSSSAPVLEEWFRALNYIVFDDNGKFITSGESMLFDTKNDFIPGSLNFSLKLPKGNYEIGLLGLNAAAGGDKWESVIVSHSPNHQFSSSIVKFTVEKDAVMPPIILNRISSKINFEFTDVTPKEKVTLRIIGKFVDSVFPFSKTKPAIYREFDLPTWSPEINSIKHNHEIVLLSDLSKESTLVDLEVTIFNNSRVSIGKKVIKGVSIKPNHITTLKGKIFDVISSSEAKNDFKAEIVKDYSKEVITQTF